MAKNIILCSDGTGNKGGYGADTNVFKFYNAVDIHDPENPQITFYDDGVGTHGNKYVRSITGAFGFGFNQNVMDLYEYLARNYKAGDKIFLFGFSRGAATVRAFAGMIQECGLLDVNNPACLENGKFNEFKFQNELAAAMAAYKKIERDPALAREFRKKAVNYSSNDGKARLSIKMIGVWDTVSALGFPQDWSWTVEWFFEAVEWVSNMVVPHNFYNYQLDQNVEWAYHVLAIDDERKTFHPKVWTENRDDRPQNIEQVWFAGAHSNVGGGYPRVELSMITLDWMMMRAEHHGVKFQTSVHDAVRAAANVHGKLYDSRDGIAIYYRYAPRDIQNLCHRDFKLRNFELKGSNFKKLAARTLKRWEIDTTPWRKNRLEGTIKVHRSVIDRIKRGANRYTPGNLPSKFEIVETPISGRRQLVEWEFDRSKIKRLVALQKLMYRVFVEATLALVVVALWFWNVTPDFPSEPIAPTDSILADAGRWLGKQAADVLIYLLPEFIEPFIIQATMVNPWVFPLIVTVLFGFYVARKRLRVVSQAACEEACQSLLEQLRGRLRRDRP